MFNQYYIYATGYCKETKSAGDKGTLFQLKELVHCTSFGKDPKHNMKATKDFLETVLFVHITAAAKEITARDSNSLINFHELCRRLVSDFIKITVPSNDTTSVAVLSQKMQSMIQCTCML